MLPHTKRTKRKIGWWTLVAMLGVMATMSAEEIKELMYWSEAAEPKFVASLLIHFGVVAGAFFGGKQMP